VNRLSPAKRTQIIASLCEGASVNSTSRITGASKVTILKLLEDVGPVCLAFQRAALVDLPCKRVQVDEIWSFVGAKERNVPRDARGRGRGDVWIWAAIDAETKLVPCWHVGARDADAAHLFIEDLASRIANRFQLTTDGYKLYLTAVDNTFGSAIDYAMLVKVYGSPPGGVAGASTRYSPGPLLEVAKWPVTGNPDPDHISTSFIERQNLTMRMNVRRLTRLTNAFSKKIENHRHALSLHYLYYNFCRSHETLTKARGGIKTTPAMAAGVARRVWTVADIVRLLESEER